MWADDVSAALSTADVGGHCLAGHRRHQTKRLTIDTVGPATIPDWPPDPAHLAHKFEMVTYDRERYADEAGCSASDTISHSLDVHGKAEAVRAFGPSFAAGEVDYALLELTPDFNDTWRTAHDAMLSHGMVAFQVPDKGDDTETFAADPLGVTLTRPFDPDQKFGQLNVFFVRKDLL
jgi:hypothetical protein